MIGKTIVVAGLAAAMAGIARDIRKETITVTVTVKDETHETGHRTARDVDVVVIGAGFSGLYMLQKLRDQMGLEVRAFETGDGVGGTWFWNRYPGARSDSESYLYSYSFDKEIVQDWNWSERYPEQQEILRYLEHVADKHDLRRSITFGTKVQDATFNEKAGHWLVTTDSGESVTAKFVISGVGSLSAANMPNFPGRDSFQGESYHTGHWPHDGVDFTGKRVAVIGTGSSGVQAVPLIAKQAADLTVFQRTANWAVPARNRVSDPKVMEAIKNDYDAIRNKARYSFAGFDIYDRMEKGAFDDTPEQRQAEFQKRWDMGGFGLWLANYNDIFFSDEANKTVCDFLEAKIQEKVKDPKTAELLVPKNQAFGCKRNPLDTGYFETFNLDTVHLVSVANNPIAEITPKGIKLQNGSEYAVDAIVYATGFDALTGPLNKINIRGRNGNLLRDKWRDGPSTYLGLMTADYPNFFMLTGPQSPSVLSNMPVSIEQHVEFTAEIINEARKSDKSLVEPSHEAEDAWVEHSQELAAASLFTKTDSWYMGANIPGKPRVFLPYFGGVGGYREKCEEIAANGYEGFTFQLNEQGAMA